MLDGQYIRVVHGFTQESQHAIETLERLMNQHIAFFEAVKNRMTPSLPHSQLGRKTRCIRREPQLRRLNAVYQLGQANQVDRAMHTVQGQLRQIKLAQQEIGQVL